MLIHCRKGSPVSQHIRSTRFAQETVFPSIRQYSQRVCPKIGNSPKKLITDLQGIMAKKPAWLLQQSAVIPFRTKDGITEVILVTSSSNKNWVLPKGRIEKLMSPEKSAAKEAFEEAGVIGDVSKNVFAEYKYNKKGNTCRVSVYPLEVAIILVQWDEMDKRDRRVLEVGAAIQLIKKEQKGILRKFQKMIDPLR